MIHIHIYMHIPLFFHLPAHMRHRWWTPKIGIHKFNLVVHWDVDHRQGTNMWSIIIWFDIPCTFSDYIIKLFFPCIVFVFGCNIHAETPSHQYKIFRGHGWSFYVYNIILYLCVCVWSVRGKCDYVNSVICTTANNFEHDINWNNLYIYVSTRIYRTQRCKFFSRRINRIIHFVTVILIYATL